jgi:hypothetical protein
MSISFPEIRVHCSDVLFTPSNFSLHIRYTTVPSFDNVRNDVNMIRNIRFTNFIISMFK